MWQNFYELHLFWKEACYLPTLKMKVYYCSQWCWRCFIPAKHSASFCLLSLIIFNVLVSKWFCVCLLFSFCKVSFVSLFFSLLDRHQLQFPASALPRLRTFEMNSYTVHSKSHNGHKIKQPQIKTGTDRQKWSPCIKTKRKWNKLLWMKATYTHLNIFKQYI